MLYRVDIFTPSLTLRREFAVETEARLCALLAARAGETAFLLRQSYGDAYEVVEQVKP